MPVLPGAVQKIAAIREYARRVSRVFCAAAVWASIAYLAMLLPVAQAADAPLFASDDVLAITIEGPLDTLIRERSIDEYYDGAVRVVGSAGEIQELDLKFRARGNYRRRKTTCRFPPVRLNFKRRQVEGTVFEGQNILKLVTHCRPRSGRLEEQVLREQLAYRILSLHTDAAFRTRLLRVTWINTERDGATEERYGFVIEHHDALQERLAMTRSELNRTTYDALEQSQASIAALFQYMIGNTDFSMISAANGEACCHNGLLLESPGASLHYVPYDFDMSGIVSAPYATANPRFNLRSVKQRLYRGHCQFNASLDDAAALFLERRDSVMALVSEQPGLDNGARRDLDRYLGQFYDQLSRDDGMERLRRSCRGDN